MVSAGYSSSETLSPAAKDSSMIWHTSESRVSERLETRPGSASSMSDVSGRATSVGRFRSPMGPPF